jgi:exonuclease SbcC
MILTHLTLRNFKRFHYADFDFRTGITGIVGNNGTGKSSLVEAVFFALFGVADKSVPSDYVVSSFANGEKAEVKLSFETGGKLYTIVRTLKKGKSVQHDATLRSGSQEENGSIAASGVATVDTEIRRILGMGPGDFRSTIYAAQKDLPTLLDLTPGKRKEWFLRALGLQHLSTGTQQILKEQADAKERESATLQGQLAALALQDPAELEKTYAHLSAIRDHIVSAEVDEDSLEKQRLGHAEGLRIYQERYAQHQSLQGQQTALQQELVTLTGKSESLAKTLQDLKIDEQEIAQLEQTVSEIPVAREEAEECRKKKGELDLLEASLKTIAREKENVGHRIATIAARLKVIEDQGKELEILREKIQQGLGIDHEVVDAETEANEYAREVSARIADLNAKQSSNMERQTDLLRKLETIEKTGSEGLCPVCLKQLGEQFDDVVKVYRENISDLRDDYASLDRNLNKALEESHRVPALKPTLSRIREIMIARGYEENLRDEQAQLGKQLDDILSQEIADRKSVDALAYHEEDHNTVRQRLVELEAAQVRLNTANKQAQLISEIRTGIAMIGTQIAAKTAAVQDLKARMDTDPLNLAAGARLQHELEKIEIALKSTREDLATSRERERTLQKHIVDLEAAAGRVETLKGQLAAVRTDIEDLKLTRAVMADYVLYLMQAVRSRLEYEVGRIIGEITGGKYDRVRLDEEFNLLVRDQDNEFSVDRYSGGEQDDIAVALRIALSRYLAELHGISDSTLLIFDEIFGSQDEERRANLLNALRSQEARFPQIILISHIAEIQGEFENTLLVQGQGPVSTVQEAV